MLVVAALALGTGAPVVNFWVVDPARWRHGLGTAVLRAAVQHSDVCDVRLCAASIDPDNHASRHCAAAAGFRPDTEIPDWENTVYHLLRRPSPDANWAAAEVTR